MEIEEKRREGIEKLCRKVQQLTRENTILRAQTYALKMIIYLLEIEAMKGGEAR